jgi:hypothetical protein
MQELTWWTPTLIFLGALLLLWKSRRQFRRTNPYGIQQFGSHGQKLRAESFDSALSGLGYWSMMAGALLVMFTDDTFAGWIALGLLVLALNARRRSHRD